MTTIRSAFLVTAALLTTLFSLGGCTSEEPTEPEPGTVRDAICSGGGGGTDECVYQNGYCSAACSMCFNSASERVQLQNLWACTACTPLDNGGAGGGGGGTTCSQCQSEYTECTTRYWTCPQLAENCAPAFYACTDRLPSSAPRCAMPRDLCDRTR